MLTSFDLWYCDVWVGGLFVCCSVCLTWWFGCLVSLLVCVSYLRDGWLLLVWVAVCLFS